jgi:hypothetical protein
VNPVLEQRLQDLYQARDAANRQILTILTRVHGHPTARVEAAEIHRQVAVETYRDHPDTIAARITDLLADDRKWHDHRSHKARNAR